MATPLPLPDDPRVPIMLGGWPQFERDAIAHGFDFPRSRWLNTFEAILREYYPQASSDQLTLTARNAAPFYLAQPNVP